MHKTFIISIPHFTAALIQRVKRSSVIGSNKIDKRKFKKTYSNNFISGINKNNSKKMIPTVPSAFFITNAEPRTVPVTLCTTEPAPGINPTILFTILFFVASTEGAIIVSNK